MQDVSEIERLRAVGVTSAETVGEILDGKGETGVKPFFPARLGENPSPPFPEPGIYFGMSDDAYHALPCLSNHGIKYLAASSMLFWARTPWLNPKKAKEVEERATEERVHHLLGKAYHCRIMEGRAEFDRRFVIGLNPADYPDALVHTDQIKAAIGRFEVDQPVKPVGKTKDELGEQLLKLGGNPEGMKVDQIKDAIRAYTETVPVKPVGKVLDTMPDTGEEYMRAAVKEDWINQLIGIDPEVQIFDRIQAEHIAQHDGKGFITLDQYEQLEIAAAMVERDPEVQHAFKGGYAEVTLIWRDLETGVLMKARVDYLKVKAMVDLKTVSNQRDRSIEQAIRYEIAGYKYNMQPAVYEAAVREVRQLVRQQGAKAVHIAEGYPYPADEVRNFALKWASHRGETEWLWVFQQKGDAPITRGVFYPLAGTTHMITKDIMRATIAKFRKCSETFGTDPWLDIAPIYTIADEDIPQSATDF